MPAEEGVNVYHLLASGLVDAPSPVPTGESMLSPVSVSPEPTEKVAWMPVDSPTYMAEELAVMVADGTDGGVTVRMPEQEPVPPFGPVTDPE